MQDDSAVTFESLLLFKLLLYLDMKINYKVICFSKMRLTKHCTYFLLRTSVATFK